MQCPTCSAVLGILGYSQRASLSGTRDTHWCWVEVAQVKRWVGGTVPVDLGARDQEGHQLHGFTFHPHSQTIQWPGKPRALEMPPVPGLCRPRSREAEEQGFLSVCCVQPSTKQGAWPVVTPSIYLSPVGWSLKTVSDMSREAPGSARATGLECVRVCCVQVCNQCEYVCTCTYARSASCASECTNMNACM